MSKFTTPQTLALLEYRRNYKEALDCGLATSLDPRLVSARTLKDIASAILALRESGRRTWHAGSLRATSAGSAHKGFKAILERALLRVAGGE